MLTYHSSNHSKWYCKYHVVFIPKYRKKVIYGNLRKYLGEIIKEMAKRRECSIEEQWGVIFKSKIFFYLKEFLAFYDNDFSCKMFFNY